MVGVPLTAHDVPLRNQRAQIVSAIVGIARHAGPAGPAGSGHFGRVYTVEP